MAKIRIMTDSASDIPDQSLARLGIDMRCIPVAVDGASYIERKDFTIEGFYDILAKAKEIPTTSAIAETEYYDCYKRAHDEGVEHVVNVTINAGGSSIFASATMAKERFYAEHPGARDRMGIHIVDSGSYCLGYGGPVMEAAQMALDGKGIEEILAYLEDCFARIEIYLGVYALDFAKRSGRIGAAAAFVGDVLGLRPVIAMIDGATRTVDKVRGEKNLAPRIVEIYKERLAEHDPDPVVVCGSERQWGEQLADLLEEELGKRPPIYPVGASIAVNSGPRMVALVGKGKRRR